MFSPSSQPANERYHFSLVHGGLIYLPPQIPQTPIQQLYAMSKPQALNEDLEDLSTSTSTSFQPLSSSSPTIHILNTSFVICILLLLKFVVLKSRKPDSPKIKYRPIRRSSILGKNPNQFGNVLLGGTHAVLSTPSPSPLIPKSLSLPPSSPMGTSPSLPGLVASPLNTPAPPSPRNVQQDIDDEI
ncbi:hypothetical protein TrLO_g9892 [Triparma laevis f. longispina]|uniref:Uncharacterized protein n=1 Tax=Triparma laevis f. longispina TaxID=1714387 RepID=A0A9W7FDY6_9STRA|nr:hypothetical protein TrLO_g9892 [Triparma laevis f. longispina]